MSRLIGVFIIAIVAIPFLGIAQEKYQDVDSLKKRFVVDNLPHKSIRSLLVEETPVSNEVDKRKEGKPRRSYIGSTIGISIPLGSFAAKSGAAAKPGIYANLLTIGYMLNSNWGFAFTSFVAIYDYDEKSAPVYNNGELVGYKANIWTNNGIMGGFLYSFPMSKGLHLDIRAMGGISQMEVTQYRIAHGMDWWGGDYSYRDEVTPVCYSVGAILRYDFRKNLSVMGSAEYFTCTPRLSDGFKSYDQPVSTYSIGIGIAYRLPF